MFPSDGPSFSRILAWRCADCVGRTRRLDPKTLCLKFPGTSRFSKVQMALSLARRNPINVQFFTIATAPLCVVFSVLKALFRLFAWLFFNLVVREQTHVPCFASRLSFIESTLKRRMPVLTRWSRANCGGVILGQGAKVLSGSAQGIHPRH